MYTSCVDHHCTHMTTAPVWPGMGVVRLSCAGASAHMIRRNLLAGATGFRETSGYALGEQGVVLSAT